MKVKRILPQRLTKVNQVKKMNIIMMNLGLKISLKQMEKCHCIHLKQLLMTSQISKKTLDLKEKEIIVSLMILLKSTSKVILLPLEELLQILTQEMMENQLQRSSLLVILMKLNDSIAIPEQLVKGFNPVQFLWCWLTNSYV